MAGAVGLPVAVAIADGRNSALKNGVQPLPEEIRAQLSMYYNKNLLDSVRYTVGSSFFNGLTQSIALKTSANAITLVNVIVFKNSEGSLDPDLWAHEMFHVRQYKKYGLHKFSAILTLDGFKNKNSAIEKPAYAFGSRFSNIRNSRNITSGLLVGLGGKCIQTIGTASRSKVVLAACKPNDQLQKWELTTKNEIRIPPKSNNCLDVQWGKSSNGTPLHIWPCNNGDAQTFKLSKKGEFRSSLKKNLCVEVAGGKTIDNTPIQVHECNNTGSQFWKKPNVNLISTSGDQCLQAVSSAKGSLVQLSSCNKNDPLQMWSSEHPKGEVRLISFPDKCLDVQWSRTRDGTPLHIWPCNGGIGAQSFHLTEAMQIKALGKCIDIANNSQSIQIFSCRDNKLSQYWNKL